MGINGMTVEVVGHENDTIANCTKYKINVQRDDAIVSTTFRRASEFKRLHARLTMLKWRVSALDLEFSIESPCDTCIKLGSHFHSDHIINARRDRFERYLKRCVEQCAMWPMSASMPQVMQKFLGLPSDPFVPISTLSSELAPEPAPASPSPELWEKKLATTRDSIRTLLDQQKQEIARMALRLATSQRSEIALISSLAQMCDAGLSDDLLMTPARDLLADLAEERRQRDVRQEQARSVLRHAVSQRNGVAIDRAIRAMEDAGLGTDAMVAEAFDVLTDLFEERCQRERARDALQHAISQRDKAAITTSIDDMRAAGLAADALMTQASIALADIAEETSQWEARQGSEPFQRSHESPRANLWVGLGVVPMVAPSSVPCSFCLPAVVPALQALGLSL